MSSTTSGLSSGLLFAGAIGAAVAAVALSKAAAGSKGAQSVGQAEPGSSRGGGQFTSSGSSSSLFSPTAAGTLIATTDTSPRTGHVAPAGASTGAGAGAGTEDPWRATEGDRVFKFDAHVREMPGMAISQLLLMEVPRLQELHPAGNAKASNVRKDLAASLRKSYSTRNIFDTQLEGTSSKGGEEGGSGLSARASLGGPRPSGNGYYNMMDDSSVILGDIVRKANQKAVSRCYIRAGPRADLYFKPAQVRAAIVTCGGLCPGLNNVIRELVETLTQTYGVDKVYGVRNGYWGFHTKDADPAGHEKGIPQVAKEEPWILTPDSVAGIQNRGGTILGSDRGGTDTEVVLRFCINRGINQLYIIGGDGTHRGAHAIHTAAVEQKVPLAVAAIPKTIDNDVDVIDRSFGFDTAVEEAQRAIRTAKVEASGAVNGVGVVKLMGRFAGFIAAHATMASGDVDLCLIPEVPLVTTGPASFLSHIERVVRMQGHAVVVVAEGAGEETLAAETPDERDAGGNRKLPPIGPWLTKKITDHLNANGIKPTLKYIDPSYMIRSVPANAADAVYCTTLAQASAHGAMAGFTGFSTGLVNNRLVYLPITLLTANSPRRMNARGRTYERLLQLTRQPDPLAYCDFYGFPQPKKGE